MEIKKATNQQMKIRRAKEQSIKVKTESIKLAGVQGAKSATREIDGGQEILDAAMTAYVISKPVRATAKQGKKLIQKKAAEEKDKRIRRREKRKDTERNKDREHSKSSSAKKGKHSDSGHSDKEHKKDRKRGIKKLIRKAQLALLLKNNPEKENQNKSHLEQLLTYRVAIPGLALLGIGLVLVALVTVPILAVIAIIYNSPFAILFPPLESGDTVQSVTSAYVAEFDREINDLTIEHLGHDIGKIVYVGYEDADVEVSNYYDILAVYMVKYGMGESATIINDTTRQQIGTVVDDMCDYTTSSGTEVILNEDGTGVSQTFLYVNVELKTCEDMTSYYGFDEEQSKIAEEIRNDLARRKDNILSEMQKSDY